MKFTILEQPRNALIKLIKNKVNKIMAATNHTHLLFNNIKLPCLYLASKALYIELVKKLKCYRKKRSRTWKQSNSSQVIIRQTKF